MVTPAGAIMTPGFFTRPDTLHDRMPGCPSLPWGRKPLNTVFQYAGHPVQGLNIVVQGWSAEQADFRDIRWPVTRHAALSFDAFKHRAFFTADIRTSTPPQFKEPGFSDTGGLQRGQFPRAGSAAPVDIHHAYRHSSDQLPPHGHRSARPQTSRGDCVPDNSGP